MGKISEKMGQSPCGLLTWVFSLTQTILQQIASLNKVTLHFKSEKKKNYKGTNIEFVKSYWKKSKEHQRGKDVEGKRYAPLHNYISEKLSHKFVGKRYEKSMKIWFIWNKHSKKIYKGKYKMLAEEFRK